MIRQRKFGALFSYLNIIAKNLVTVVYTPFLLKFVGQANYGLFQMTNSIMLSLSLISMGFSGAYVRFYMIYKTEDDQEQIKKLNAMYLLLFSAFSVFSLIVGLLFINNVDMLFSKSLTGTQLQLMRYLMAIMILNVVIVSISCVFDSYITVNQRFLFQQSRQLMQTLLVPILCVPMVLLGTGVLSIGIAQTVISLIFLGLNIDYCFRKLKMYFDFHALPIKVFQQIALFSFFVFLNQTVDLVNNNIPNFILGMFTGAKAVATFSIAMMLKNLFFYMAVSLSNVFIPRINELVSAKISNKELTQLMIKIGRLQMSLLFFIFGGFVILGQYFINKWAGPNNGATYLLTIIMVLPSIVPLSQSIGIEIQRAMNMHVFRSVVYIAFAVINVITTAIGTIHYGLIGGVIGYVITIVFANGIAMNLYYQKKMKLDMRQYWLEAFKIMLPALIVTTMLLLSRMVINLDSLQSFIGYGIVYCLLYLTIHMRFIANQYEKDLVFSVLRKVGLDKSNLKMKLGHKKQVLAKTCFL